MSFENALYFQEQEKIKEIANEICNFLSEKHSDITLAQVKEIFHKSALMLEHKTTLSNA